jgi:hypothetical protein
LDTQNQLKMIFWWERLRELGDQYFDTLLLLNIFFSGKMRGIGMDNFGEWRTVVFAKLLFRNHLN